MILLWRVLQGLYTCSCWLHFYTTTSSRADTSHRGTPVSSELYTPFSLSRPSPPPFSLSLPSLLLPPSLTPSPPLFSPLLSLPPLPPLSPPPLPPSLSPSPPPFSLSLPSPQSQRNLCQALCHVWAHSYLT